MKDGVLNVWLTEPAENNKANQQLVKRLAKRFGGCRLVRGATSSKKVLELPVSSLKELPL